MASKTVKKAVFALVHCSWTASGGLGLPIFTVRPDNILRKRSGGITPWAQALLEAQELSPEYVFIFDHLGADLTDPSITQLFKTSRHYKAKVIVNSQYVHDLSCIKNLDYTLIFKSFNRKN